MGKTCRCPRCGTIAQGQQINNSNGNSFGERCLKKATKQGFNNITKNAGQTVGMAIGDAIMPGVGIFVGSVIGSVVTDIAFDKTYDKVKDTMSSDEYIYQCPTCGHVWTDSDDMIFEEYDSEDNYDDDFESYEEKRTEEYEKRDSYFWNNIESIVSSPENVKEFVEQHYKTYNNSSSFKDEIESKHYVLDALACLIYLSDNQNDRNITLLGKDCIKRAKNNINGHDKEIEMIDVIFSICGINPNSGDIVALQRNIAKKAPKKQALNNSRFLKSEALYGLYEAFRYKSFIDSKNALAEKGRYKDAIEIFEMMQDLENPDYKLIGYDLMVDAYKQGRGVIQSDERACFYIQKCIDQKSFDTPYEENIFNYIWAFNLGNMADRAMYGRGRSIDYAYALKCAKKSAEFNCVAGFLNMGEIYENGFGVPKDYSQALYWYKKALNSDRDDIREFAQEKINAIEATVELVPKPSYSSNSQSNSRTMSSNTEKEYIDEVKACLEEGEITSGERRLLNKLRERLGISVDRAEMLEASLTCIQLTDDEREYLEEYKACLADGGSITSGERRLLDRMMKAYGISSERAKEIEDSVK